MGRRAGHVAAAVSARRSCRPHHPVDPRRRDDVLHRTSAAQRDPAARGRLHRRVHRPRRHARARHAQHEQSCPPLDGRGALRRRMRAGGVGLTDRTQQRRGTRHRPARRGDASNHPRHRTRRAPQRAPTHRSATPPRTADGWRCAARADGHRQRARARADNSFQARCAGSGAAVWTRRPACPWGVPGCAGARVGGHVGQGPLCRRGRRRGTRRRSRDVEPARRRRCRAPDAAQPRAAAAAVRRRRGVLGADLHLERAAGRARRKLQMDRGASRRRAARRRTPRQRAAGHLSRRRRLHRRRSAVTRDAAREPARTGPERRAAHRRPRQAMPSSDPGAVRNDERQVGATHRGCRPHRPRLLGATRLVGGRRRAHPIAHRRCLTSAPRR